MSKWPMEGPWPPSTQRLLCARGSWTSRASRQKFTSADSSMWSSCLLSISVLHWLGLTCRRLSTTRPNTSALRRPLSIGFPRPSCLLPSPPTGRPLWLSGKCQVFHDDFQCTDNYWDLGHVRRNAFQKLRPRAFRPLYHRRASILCHHPPHSVFGDVVRVRKPSFSNSSLVACRYLGRHRRPIHHGSLDQISRRRHSRYSIPEHPLVSGGMSGGICSCKIANSTRSGRSTRAKPFVPTGTTNALYTSRVLSDWGHFRHAFWHLQFHVIPHLSDVHALRIHRQPVRRCRVPRHCSRARHIAHSILSCRHVPMP